MAGTLAMRVRLPAPGRREEATSPRPRCAGTVPRHAQRLLRARRPPRVPLRRCRRLERLAAHAGARALGGGHALVAEWAGRVVAAVSMHDGRAVADPTAGALDAVAVLRRAAAA